MLVLSRKINEKIIIGKGRQKITVTILRIQGGDKVSIGIDADREIFPVFRHELLDPQTEEEYQQEAQSISEELVKEII